MKIQVYSFVVHAFFLSIIFQTIYLSNGLQNRVPPSSVIHTTNKTLGKGMLLPNATITGSVALLKDLPNNIPLPSNILSYGKNAMMGLPFEVALTAVNRLCSLLVGANGTKPNNTPDASKMHFILLTPSGENVTVSLTDSMTLWRHPLFDTNKKTVIFITGFLTDVDDPYINFAFLDMWKAFKERKDYNFIFVDSARYIDSLYTWSSFNTQEIGEAIGIALVQLNDFLPDMYIHVMGHSLGAHIASAAGVSYQYNSEGKRLPRITGLDPANPCFNEGEELSGLMRGDADFVDVLHTNNGGFGKKEPCGDADFYANGRVILQPGTLEIVSAHMRAPTLFAQTVYPGLGNLFTAVQCNSMFALQSGKCKRKPVFFGLDTPTDIKGNYYFETSGRPPFTV